MGRFPQETNKKVGLLYSNNANGLTYANDKTGVPPVLTEKGYTYVMPDLYPPGMEDFTQIISLFKKEGCEILMGSTSTPDLSNFWKQSLQQGFNPKLLANGIALLFPKGVESIGDIITNGLAEAHWHNTYPWKSSLNGQTCQEICDEYEAATGMQWSMPLLLHKLFEWTIDVLKRSTDPDDPKTIADAIRGTNLMTVHGPIDFTQPINAIHLHPNVVRSPVIAGQWQKGTAHPFELVIVGNEGWPELPVGGEVLPLIYS